MEFTKAKRHFSQNFLVNQSIITKILHATDLTGKRVLEIGPGHGALTDGILKKAHELVVYEIDQAIITELANKYANELRLSIVPGDVLARPFDCTDNCVLIGNIPYHITTPILFKIFAEISKFSVVVLMVQKEFADRLLAKVNDSIYGKLTISAMHYGHFTRMLDVSRNDFSPRPNVDSTVVKLIPHTKRRGEEVAFLDFINHAFQFRRKTLINNVKDIINEHELVAWLLKQAITPKVRPQNISYEMFWMMFQTFIAKQQ